MSHLKLKIPPVVIFFLCLGLVWIIKSYMPAWLDIMTSKEIVAGIIAVGALIAVAGVIQFFVSSTSVDPHKPEKASKLVSSGIYRISRNPMYLGMLIFLIAAVLKWGEPLGLLVIPLYVIYMDHFQIRPEEEIMEQKFGEEYRVYKDKVRRWI